MKNWFESTKQLQAEGPKSFSLFINWVYEGSTAPLKLIPDSTTHNDDTIEWNWNPYKLYGLPYRLQVIEFMDLVMDGPLEHTACN